MSAARPPAFGTQAYRRAYLRRLEALWARRPDVTLSALHLEASRAVVLARLENRPAPEGMSGSCDPVEHDEKMLEILAWYLDSGAERGARDKPPGAAPAHKAPAFSSRAVSARLTRAGLTKRTAGRHSSGDFYVGAAARWTLPKGSPPTIDICICPSEGGAESRMLCHEKAVRVLESAGYTLGKNKPPDGLHGFGRIWVIGPQVAEAAP